MLSSHTSTHFSWEGFRGFFSLALMFLHLSYKSSCSFLVIIQIELHIFEGLLFYFSLLPYSAACSCWLCSVLPLTFGKMYAFVLWLKQEYLNHSQISSEDFAFTGPSFRFLLSIYVTFMLFSFVNIARQFFISLFTQNCWDVCSKVALWQECHDNFI